MFKTLKKLFDNEYKELYRFSKLADQIDALDEEMSKLSDKKLASYTDKFKKRLEDGETLDDILVEAFAVAREAAYRCLGMKPFYCQLLGGLAIHYGNIAEMKTGEGKTLTCVLPAYLNALTGKGVHIVTVNEFLSTRDSEWMGSIFKFLGLTVGLNLRELSFKEKTFKISFLILFFLFSRGKISSEFEIAIFAPKLFFSSFFAYFCIFFNICSLFFILFERKSKNILQ